MSDVAKFAPDYEEFFMQETMSDVTLIVQHEHNALGKRKRAGVMTIPGHRMVLAAFSNYFKAQMVNWNHDDADSSVGSKKGKPKKHEIILPVPDGQEHLARLLVRGIYQKQPNITAELTDKQLLQLMLLADRFEVPKVQSAVYEALSNVPLEQLQWQTVLDLLELPPSCAAQQDFKALQEMAAKRLLQELGDLEAVWADKQLQQQLLALPFDVAKQLLQHPDICVNSENTVVHSVLAWYEAAQARSPAALNESSSGPYRQRLHLEQLQQLMAQVRLPQCTPYFLSTVLMQHEQVLACFTHFELAVAMQCSTPQRSSELSSRFYTHPALEKFPAWMKGKRPLSKKQSVIECCVPLHDLVSLVEACIEGKDADDCILVVCRNCILQGRRLNLFFMTNDYNNDSNASDVVGVRSSAQSLTLAFGLAVLDLPEGAACHVSAVLYLEAAVTPAAGSAAQPLGFSASTSMTVSQQDQMCFWPVMLELGHVSSWLEAEQQLRMKQLVHAPDQHCSKPYLRCKVHLRALL